MKSNNNNDGGIDWLEPEEEAQRRSSVELVAARGLELWFVNLSARHVTILPKYNIATLS